MPNKPASDQTTPNTVKPARPRAPRKPKNGNGTANDAPASMLTSSEPSYDQIAEAAYQRFLQRGGSHGSDFEDWLEAERELRSRSR